MQRTAGTPTSLFIRTLAFILCGSILLPSLQVAANPYDKHDPWASGSDSPTDGGPPLYISGPLKISACQVPVSDATTRGLEDLQSDSAQQAACERAGACGKNQPISSSPVAKPFLFMYKLVVQVGVEINESFKAIQGKTLRSRPTALLDFVKNMAIIWPGQVFGWYQNKIAKGETPTAANAPYDILGHTLFMVWTQSERGAQKTPEVAAALPEPPKNVQELAPKVWQMVRDAYKGKEGFWKENLNRLWGFLSIIPLEILSLSILVSLKALPGILETGALPDQFGKLFENRAIFAVLFGIYLSLKWALVSKVFDLRILPTVRHWMSSKWTSHWQNLKRRYGLRADLGDSVDDITLGRLLTTDLIRAVRVKPFKTKFEGCQLVAKTTMGDETQYEVTDAYCQRWQAYMDFMGEKEYWKAIRENPKGYVSHLLGLPLEMAYRYGNSFIDGFLVFYLTESAIPLLMQKLHGP
jgi:hypothetical protein